MPTNFLKFGFIKLVQTSKVLKLRNKKKTAINVILNQNPVIMKL